MQRTCTQLCPMFQAAMAVLAKPWTGMLVALLEHGPLRFSEIGEHIPALGDRTLSARLKELEAEGVLLRCVHPGPPVRVEYALTAVGQQFSEVVKAISQWGLALSQEKLRQNR